MAAHAVLACAWLGAADGWALQAVFCGWQLESVLTGNLTDMPPVPDGHAAPANWIRELARMQPARWPVGLSIRAAITIGAPFIVGVATDSTSDCMWIAMGALMLASGERRAPYRTIFRQVLISAPIGAAGYLAGYLGALPWAAVVVAMMLVGFLAGIVSSYGQAFSAGALQLLLTAGIAIGIPAIDPFWRCSLMFLGGAAAYACLLGVEALLARRQRQRHILADLINAAARLARARAAPAPEAEIEAARRAVTDGLGAAYEALIDSNGLSSGAAGEPAAHGAILQAVDQLFTVILSSDSPEALDAAAGQLADLAAAMASGRPSPPAIGSGAPAGPLLGAVAALQAAWQAAGAGGQNAAAPGGAPANATAGRRFTVSVILDRLACGRETVMSALALALCLGLAYATRWFNDASHWYWVPLTVGIVMKPDFGSVFTRAVLRGVGTVGGVLIGAAALIFIPKGLLLALLTVVLAATLPWAKQRSYAVQTVVLTPLVLILIDLAHPGLKNIDYGLQRVVDTLIGSAIVLAFGYFPWRRGQQRQVAHAFHAARAGIADCLRATISAQGRQQAIVARRRRAAYGALSNLRVQLQRSMAEPPPAGREAAAWLPLVACAERICDGITIWSTREPAPLADGDARTVARLADAIDGQASPADAARLTSTDPGVAALVAGVAAELARLDRLTEVKNAPAASGPAAPARPEVPRQEFPGPEFPGPEFPPAGKAG